MISNYSPPLPPLPDGYIFVVDTTGSYIIDTDGNYLITPGINPPPTPDTSTGVNYFSGHQYRNVPRLNIKALR